MEKYAARICRELPLGGKLAEEAIHMIRMAGKEGGWLKPAAVYVACRRLGLGFGEEDLRSGRGLRYYSQKLLRLFFS